MPSPIPPLVAVAEGRELEKLAGMLETGGAEVLRCPMLAMTAPDDPSPVSGFITRTIDGGFDDILFMTGEGVARLFAQASRESRAEALVAALKSIRVVARGSKAMRELKTRGLPPALVAEPPTTEGLLAAWGDAPPSGKRVGVVRSGDEVAGAEKWLAGIAAEVHPVSSYVYRSDPDSAAVGALLEKLGRGDVRVLALTSIAQARALLNAAEKRGTPLPTLLGRTLVASIGPALTTFLKENGIPVALEPAGKTFLSPFAKAILAAA